jgi:hypothetical protein
MRRWRISEAAASVYVRQRIPDGGVSVSLMIFPMRKDRISVLPVPGPAITMTGPSMESTARRWLGLRFSSFSSKVMVYKKAKASLKAKAKAKAKVRLRLGKGVVERTVTELSHMAAREQVEVAETTS